MAPAIAIDRLYKRFGHTQALDGLTLEVEQGDVFGFLGPNGAGKTTTMRILATLLKPDAGAAYVLGRNAVSQPSEVRPLIGYMPDTSGAYRDMLVGEYLDFFAAAYGMPAAERPRIVNDVVELTGLQGKREELIEGLSRGMRQRLGLARCLIHDPAVLILDEPASGLDPRARLENQEILRALAAMGKTVFISSHILSELRHLCNRIGIIDRGRLVYCGSIDAALERARTARRLDVRLVDGLDAAAALLAGCPEVVSSSVDDGHVRVELRPDVEDYSFIADLLVHAGFRILTLREEEILLEDAFLKLTEGAAPGQ